MMKRRHRLAEVLLTEYHSMETSMRLPVDSNMLLMMIWRLLWRYFLATHSTIQVGETFPVCLHLEKQIKRCNTRSIVGAQIKWVSCIKGLSLMNFDHFSENRFCWVRHYIKWWWSLCPRWKRVLMDDAIANDIIVERQSNELIFRSFGPECFVSNQQGQCERRLLMPLLKISSSLFERTYCSIDNQLISLGLRLTLLLPAHVCLFFSEHGPMRGWSELVGIKHRTVVRTTLQFDIAVAWNCCWHRLASCTWHSPYRIALSYSALKEVEASAQRHQSIEALHGYDGMAHRIRDSNAFVVIFHGLVQLFWSWHCPPSWASILPSEKHLSHHVNASARCWIPHEHKAEQI